MKPCHLQCLLECCDKMSTGKWCAININSSPGVVCRRAKYTKTDVTGLSASPVLPKYKVTPAPKGFVLLSQRCTAKHSGFKCESTLISTVDSMEWEKPPKNWQMNSPHRRNPQKGQTTCKVCKKTPSPTSEEGWRPGGEYSREENG